MKKQSSHWWQNAFSFSSSKSTSDDISVGSRYSRRPSFFSSRGGRVGRHISRGKKVRHSIDSDSEGWRNPTSSSSDISSARFGSSCLPEAPPQPQPLPLPELQTLLRRDAKSASVNSDSNYTNVLLPSPRDSIPKFPATEEKEKEKTSASNRVVHNDGATTAGNSVARLSQDAQRNLEQSDAWSSRRSPPKLNGIGRAPDNRTYNIPVSAPTSPYSSPALSPHINNGDALTPPQYVTPPSFFQVWSAPEMPTSDPILGPTFIYPVSSEVAAFSADNTPLPSPSWSYSKSPNGPASPLSNKLAMEASIGRRDNTAQVNVHPKTGALCALKEVEMLPDDPKSAESIRQLEQEIKVLRHLKHPNIVQYYGSEIVGDRFYIYLEYVHPGSINKFIRDHFGGITESVVRNFTRHILCGLAYLHSKKTIHRDIKGANLLVDAYGVVKLADFGMAKHLNGHAANLSLKGSPYWMAPELLQSVMQQDSNADLALAVDIWSLGCTIIEMFSGKPPWSEYEGAAAMFKVLKETPPIPENLSAEGKDFLSCCFRRNPAERASASMLLEHPFVRNSHPSDAVSRALSPTAFKSRDITREHLRLKLDQVPVYTDAVSRAQSPTVNKLRDCTTENLKLKLDEVPVHADMHMARGKMNDNLLNASLSQMRLANDVSTKL
ncbi:OLC1v1010096C1 [Oldenlandia corymbosa var. corymbosa]|uniref:OLC1v1010096C1 n=1 Tax=Oldenlandia corymbosa var. corymbosa TaxID=529605 RepID=A0AAV1DQG5_OLDCO|nr:OLC1v1010096C1 [Oldenlandia corymbosa var. corymbosa]